MEKHNNTKTKRHSDGIKKLFCFCILLYSQKYLYHHICNYKLCGLHPKTPTLSYPKRGSFNP
jgi:hypothetical protein